MVRDTKVIHGEIADGGRVSDDQVQSISFGVSGDVNMLVEVEAVQQLLEVQSRGAGGVIYVNVDVA